MLSNELKWPSIFDKKPWELPNSTPFTEGQWMDFKEALDKMKKRIKEKEELSKKKEVTKEMYESRKGWGWPATQGETAVVPKASDIQVGGSHYKDFKIQPFEFFLANQIPFHKADIIKRILRYDKPTGKGIEDLKKIKHEIELIIEIEGLK